MLSIAKDLHVFYTKSNIADFKKDQYSNILKNISSICDSMKIIDGLEFLGLKKIDHTELRRTNVKIDNSEYFRVICYFKFWNEEKTESEEFNFKITVPKLLDEHYFKINGVEYSGIGVLSNYQPIHDTKEKLSTILIKTLINNFLVELKNTTRRRSASYVKVFTKNIHLSLFLLLLNECDIKGLFNHLFGEGKWHEMEKTPESVKATNDRDDCIIFKDMIITIDEPEPWHLKIINSFGKLSYNRIIDDKNYTIRQLGKNYSGNTNSYLEKGSIVLKTINRSLDDITSKLLEVDSLLDLFLREIKKVESGESVDSNDVRDKRISFIDVILFPLYKRVSDNLYIYLNSRRKNIGNVFKIKESIIIDFITTSDVLQYNDSTSAFDSFQNSKVSLSPIGLKKEKVGKKMRKIHPSEIGIIDLISTPNGKSTGLSSYLVTYGDGNYVLDSNSVIREKFSKGK